MKGLCVVLALLGCGPARYEIISPPKKPINNWKTLGKAVVTIGKADSYMLAENVSITYTSSIVTQFVLNVTTVVVGSEDESSYQLALGSFNIDKLRLNKLDVCGVGGNERCTAARIALYTQELIGYTGIGGFVNIDEGYGVPILAEGVALGLGSGSAIGVETLDITSTAIKRITAASFSYTPYTLTSDFSNAGAGNYEVDVVIELQLGN